MTTGPEEYETWRDKYLNALDRQETLERQADEQYQLMRRLLVQLSLVADGRDPEVDATLDELRKVVRGERPVAGLVSIAERLDSNVRAFEEVRDHRDDEIRSALSALVFQLQATGLSRELKRELGQYLNSVQARSSKQGLFPELLQQLSVLQQHALEQIKTPRTGFWGRRRAVENDDALGVSVPELEGAIRQALEQVLAVIPTEHLGFTASEALRQQLNEGLPLSELPNFLAMLRDLLMRSWASFNDVFVRYLDNVNAELENISKLVRHVIEQETYWHEASRALTTQMNEQCSALENSVQNASDIEQLKRQVTTHLGEIRKGVQQFRRRSSEGSPTRDHLAQVTQSIQQMEETAEQNRANLENQPGKPLDPLTQLPNRDAYEERVVYETSRWKRFDLPLTLAVCDVDYFKRINERFGHQAGDRVLKLLSRAFARRLRESDFLGRYGGEEFVLLLPDTRVEDAFRLLDDLRTALAATEFNYNKEPLMLTFSAGLTGFREGDSPRTAFTRARDALLEAKAAGRNRCQIG